MIDLHIHSNNSDGTKTVEEIVQEAKEKKLSLIALTDHNTFNGCSKFAEIAEIYNQPALVGIEISTVYKGEEIHLLGYFPAKSNFFYPQYDSLTKMNKTYSDGKINQLKAMVEKLSADYDVSVKEFQEFLKINNIKNINRVHLANYLMSKGIVDSVRNAFDYFLNEQSKYYVKKEQTDLLYAIKEVVSAGGFPTIAHLNQYNLDSNEIEQLLINISNITKEFGVELLHPDHSKNNISEYIDLCNFIQLKTKSQIVFTAGSDFHGENKPNQIGKVCDFEMDSETIQLYENISKDFIEYITEKHKAKEEIKLER